MPCASAGNANEEGTLILSIPYTVNPIGSKPCQKAISLIFQLDTKEMESRDRKFRGRCQGPGAFPESRLVTSVSTESSSHLPSDMYNLAAFDLCGCQQYPALKRDLPALSCEFQRILQPKEHGQHHGNRNSKVV